MAIDDIYMTHGYQGGVANSIIANTFNTTGLTWTTVTSGSNGRYSAYGLESNGSSINVHGLFGGSPDGGASGVTFSEILGKTTNTWHSVTVLPTVKLGGLEVGMEDYAWIGPAASSSVAYEAILYRSPFSTFVWSTMTAAPASNGATGGGVDVVSAKLRSVCGYNGGNHANVYQYVYSTGLWSTKGASGALAGGGAKIFSDDTGTYGYYNGAQGGSTAEYRRFGWASDVHSARTGTSSTHGYGSNEKASGTLGYVCGGGATQNSVNEKLTYASNTVSTSTAVGSTQYGGASSGPAVLGDVYTIQVQWDNASVWTDVTTQSGDAGAGVAASAANTAYWETPSADIGAVESNIDIRITATLDA